jgi:S-adenosylmethionine:diacylglycerol 3-amino-3-carboxypropyl transferase
VKLFSNCLQKQQHQSLQQEQQEQKEEVVDKVLNETIKKYNQKLVQKDSFHQLMNFLRERNAPEETIDAFEKFQSFMMNRISKSKIKRMTTTTTTIH